MRHPHFLYHFEVKRPKAKRGFNWGLFGVFLFGIAIWVGVFYLAHRAYLALGGF